MILTRQFFIYVAIGVISALVDIGILQISFFTIGGLFLPTALSYVSGLIVNFALHNIFTFKTSISFHRAVKYLTVVAVNYWIAFVFVYLSTIYFNNVLYGKVLSLPLIAVVGFILSKKWIYKN